MVVDRDREDLLGDVLADHVLVEDLRGSRAGVGRSDFAPWRASRRRAASSRMMSLQSSMHSSQMNTDGPAMSFLTSCWLLPQKEQYRSFSLEEPFFSAMDVVKRRRPQGVRNHHSGKENATLPGERPRTAVLLSSRRAGAIVGQFFALARPQRGCVGGVARRQHLVDQAVRLRLLGIHEEVALGVARDLLDRLAGVLGVASCSAARASSGSRLAWISMSVAWPCEPPERLVDHHARVRQRECACPSAPAASRNEPMLRGDARCTASRRRA